MGVAKELDDALDRANLTVLGEVDILVCAAVNRLFNEAWLTSGRLLTREQVAAVIGNRLALYTSEKAIECWHLARREAENGEGN